MNIYQIEITNYCTNQCNYCPRSLMKRPMGIMDIRTLNHILLKIENDTLRLYHYGESLLDDKLEDKIRLIKERKPNIKLILKTNGSLLEPNRVDSLFEAGLDEITLTYHNEKSIKYINDIKLIHRNNITIIRMCTDETEADAMTALGQFEGFGYKLDIKKLRNIYNNETNESNKECPFIKNNQVVVLWNGDIVPCSECFDNKDILGNIFQDNIVKNKSFGLCKKCLKY